MNYAQMLQTADQFLKSVHYYLFQQLVLRLSPLHMVTGMLSQLLITNSGLHYALVYNLFQQCIFCSDFSKIYTGF